MTPITKVQPWCRVNGSAGTLRAGEWQIVAFRSAKGDTCFRAARNAADASA